MKSTQIAQMLKIAVMNKRRVLLVSRGGMGKTSLVKQVAKETNADMTTLHVSISDPTKFEGFYCIVNDVPQVVPFEVLDKIYNADKLHIVFLDDFGQGAPATQAACMAFMDKLLDNPHVVIIAATNRREDRANVSGLLEPVKSRFDSILNMEFDVEAFINDFMLPEVNSGRQPIELVAFLKFRPELVYADKPSLDLVNIACPRTIEALGKWMLLDIPDECQYEIYSGAVGSGFAIELLGFLPIWRKLPSIDAIMLNPESVKLPASGDKHSLSVHFAVCKALVRKCTENTFSRIITLAERLNKELEIMLITDCIRFCPEVQQSADFIRWSSKNQNVLL